MISREPITDPAFPAFPAFLAFLDVTGTLKANTVAEVVRWTEDGEMPYETARLHVWKELSGCRVEEYRRGTPRHFFSLEFGGQPGVPGEAVVYLSPAQFAALREAVNGEVKSHYANEVEGLR